MDGILKDIELVGKVTGTEKRAKELIKDMKERMSRVVSRVEGTPRVKVFYIIDATDLINELCRIGLPPLPSRTNLFLVRVDNGKAFRNALLRHGILVRDCTSFGLPEYVRIAARTMPECQRLIATIQAMKAEGELEATQVFILIFFGLI